MDGNITHARKTEIRCLKPRDDSQWENKETKPPISGHAASHLFHYYYYYYDKYLKAILFSLQKLHGAAVWIFVTAPHVTQFIGLCLQRTYLTREKKKKDILLLPPFSTNLGSLEGAETTNCLGTTHILDYRGEEPFVQRDVVN